MTTSDIWKLGLQYAKFGGVGLAATGAHVLLFTGLIEVFDLDPLVANFLAFSLAFSISFFGHFHWTFGGDDVRRRAPGAAFKRFLVTALTGLGLNTLVVYIVDQVFVLAYAYSIIGFIFVVPPVLFLMSKYWAFHDPEQK